MRGPDTLTSPVFATAVHPINLVYNCLVLHYPCLPLAFTLLPYEMKRPAEDAKTNGSGAQSKRRALDDEDARASFRDGLFETAAHEESREAYASSEPYVELLLPLVTYPT